MTLPFDILNWGKHDGHQFETLSAISRDLFANLILIVAFESTFSIGGHLVDSSCFLLAPRTIDALICIQNFVTFNLIDINFYKYF